MKIVFENDKTFLKKTKRILDNVIQKNVVVEKCVD